tara:strand:- start:72 stop:326 length:255 start_codon:yes stop_codon:yes gene_type:complete
MKKSNKEKLNPEDLNPEDVMKDANKLLDFIDEFENVDYMTENLSKLEKKVKNIEKNFRKKYSNYLPKDFDEKMKEKLDDLDSKE